MVNHPPFRPAWWLPGAHLPTLWTKFGRRLAPAHERLEQWVMSDGDTVTIARVDAATETAPTLFILHGLEGTIRSTYAQGLMRQAKLRGWGADRKSVV